MKINIIHAEEYILFSATIVRIRVGEKRDVQSEVK